MSVRGKPIAATAIADRYAIRCLLAAGEEAPPASQAVREGTVARLVDFMGRGRRAQAAVDGIVAAVGVDAQEAAKARQARVAEGLKGRNFPAAPSRVGELQAPLEASRDQAEGG